MPRSEDENLDMISGLSARRDDAHPRRPKPKENPQQAQPKRAAAAQAPQQAVVPDKQPSRVGGVLVAVLILALAAASGWLGMQVLDLRQQLAATTSSLDLARTRIDQLGQQVFAADSSFNETGNVINEKFDFFDSEIRKLWDVSNKRNKRAIQQNTEQLKSLDASVKKAANQSDVANLTQQLKSQTAATQGQSEQLLLVRSELDLIQQRVSEIPANLTARVRNNEEAVEAIDAARRQLVGNIAQIQDRVNQLQRLVNGEQPSQGALQQ